jgi:hypothetical protein
MSHDELPPDELRDTDALDERTPLVDPGSLPRFGKRGDARREPAIVDEQPVGVMRGHVTITPIRRLDRGVYFEVGAEWGPNADESDVAGLFGLPAHRVVDAVAVDEEEGARKIARAAIEQLHNAASSDPHAGDAPAVNLPAIAARLGVALLRQ